MIKYGCSELSVLRLLNNSKTQNKQNHLAEINNIVVASKKAFYFIFAWQLETQIITSIFGKKLVLDSLYKNRLQYSTRYRIFV